MKHTFWKSNKAEGKTPVQQVHSKWDWKQDYFTFLFQINLTVFWILCRRKQTNYLVEEILHKLRDAYIVIVSVDQEHLLKVFELWDGIVTVPHCLPTLLSHDALTVMVIRSHRKIYIMVIFFQPILKTLVMWQTNPFFTYYSFSELYTFTRLRKADKRRATSHV